MTETPSGIPPRPNFYITRENLNELVGPGFWKVNDLPQERWNLIKDHFGSVNTFAVFASGIAPTQHTFQPPPSSLVGGIDWVRIENKPRAGEPPLNVYHYVIGQPDEFGYPVYGPIKDGSSASHWSELKDLDVYFNDDQKKESKKDG